MTHLRTDATLCFFIILRPPHLTFIPLGWHWRLWHTNINQRFCVCVCVCMCTFQHGNTIFSELDFAKDVQNAVEQWCVEGAKPSGWVVVNAAYRAPLRRPAALSSCCALHMNTVMPLSTWLASRNTNKTELTQKKYTKKQIQISKGENGSLSLTQP